MTGLKVDFFSRVIDTVDIYFYIHWTHTTFTGGATVGGGTYRCGSLASFGWSNSVTVVAVVVDGGRRRCRVRSAHSARMGGTTKIRNSFVRGGLDDRGLSSAPVLSSVVVSQAEVFEIRPM